MYKITRLFPPILLWVEFSSNDSSDSRSSNFLDANVRTMLFSKLKFQALNLCYDFFQ